MRVQRLLKLCLIIGLVLALLAMAPINGQMGMKAKLFILLSRYRGLLPYIVAQAKHETAYNGIPFNSPVYKANNNMFGMKNGSIISPGESVGTMSPEGNTYAKYGTDFNSLEDLIQWFDWKKMPVTVDSAEEYVKAVTDRGYIGFNPSQSAKDNYLKGLKRWL